MVVFSKFGHQLGVVLARYSQKAQPLTLVSNRLCHARVFRKRQGQLLVSRFKDAVHFYMLGVGLFPVLAITIYVHIKYGPCELAIETKNGPPPRYWQYERTYIRQWYAKMFGISDVEHHERQLAYTVRAAILAKWRRLDERVRHLEAELWDYKAWTYQPISAAWIDYGKWNALRMKHQHESHGVYTY